MSYLFMEIVVYLLVAGLIGFVLGWGIRGSSKNKPLDNSEITSAKAENIEEIKTSTPTLLKKAKDGKKDKLSLIKGIGPVLEDRLNQLGIYHFEQIASWDESQQAWIDIQILFPRKVEREEWVKQAKELRLS